MTTSNNETQIENIDLLGSILFSLLLVCLAIGAVYSYNSIEWDILQKLESTKLQLPPPPESNQINQPAVSPALPQVNMGAEDQKP